MNKTPLAMGVESRQTGEATRDFNEMGRLLSKEWKKVQGESRYASASVPLWEVAAKFLRVAYITGHSDADYEANRILDSIEKDGLPIDPREWLLRGGGGFEGGEDGLKAATFSSHGLIEMLHDYGVSLISSRPTQSTGTTGNKESSAAAVAPLIEALRRLLLSADSSWEIMGLGHDWKEACETARAALAGQDTPTKDL